MEDNYGPPDSADILYYDERINRFRDECYKVVHNLSPYFALWQLEQWKKGKDYGILKDRSGGLWELFYEPSCSSNCKTCRNKCEIYRDITHDWKREENLKWIERIY